MRIFHGLVRRRPFLLLFFWWSVFFLLGSIVFVIFLAHTHTLSARLLGFVLFFIRPTSKQVCAGGGDASVYLDEFWPVDVVVVFIFRQTQAER